MDRYRNLEGGLGVLLYISQVSISKNLGRVPNCTAKAAPDWYTKSFGYIFAANGTLTDEKARDHLEFLHHNSRVPISTLCQPPPNRGLGSSDYI